MTYKKASHSTLKCFGVKLMFSYSACWEGGFSRDMVDRYKTSTLAISS